MKHRPVYIPSLFTILNLLFGFLSIIQMVDGNLNRAAWLIIIAILCDGMDGKIARWTNSESTFGFELDSLADLVSFGVAPALFLYLAVFPANPLLGASLGFIYLFAGGYRLARFNADQAGDRSTGYQGLPIPVAAMLLASFWLFGIHVPVADNLIFWITLVSAAFVLMLSAVPYDWPKLSFHGGIRQVLSSVGILVSIVAMSVFPERSLFPLFLLYAFLGIGTWMMNVVRQQVEWRTFFKQIH